MDKILTGSTDPVPDVGLSSVSKSSASDHVHTSVSDPRHLVELLDDQELEETSFGDDKIGPGIDGILRQDLLKSMGQHPLASLIGSKMVGAAIGGNNSAKNDADEMPVAVGVILMVLSVVSSLFDTNVWIMEATAALIVFVGCSPLSHKDSSMKLTMSMIAHGCITSFFTFILVQAMKLEFDIKTII